MSFRKKLCYIIMCYYHSTSCILYIIEKYQKLENEKKTTRSVRKTHVGTMIRYQSLSMPVMVLSTCIDEDEKINVECDDEKNVNTVSNNTGSDSSLKEGRYIYIFIIVAKYIRMHKKGKTSNIELTFYSNYFMYLII